MKCPKCNANMIWGHFSNEQSGPDQLQFQEPGNEWVAVEQDTGFYCEECDLFVICESNIDDTETSCLACGAVMEPGVKVCPQCGWTYETPSG
jgi:hypothetical protein